MEPLNKVQMTVYEYCQSHGKNFKKISDVFQDVTNVILIEKKIKDKEDIISGRVASLLYNLCSQLDALKIINICDMNRLKDRIINILKGIDNENNNEIICKYISIAYEVENKGMRNIRRQHIRCKKMNIPMLNDNTLKTKDTSTFMGKVIDSYEKDKAIVYDIQHFNNLLKDKIKEYEEFIDYFKNKKRINFCEIYKNMSDV
jgi:hypothetical protein